MNFDSKIIIGILFQTHREFTTNKPFYRHPIKNLKKLEENREKINQLILDFNNEESFLIFSNNCLKELNKLNLAYGTAHYGYKYWVSVYLTSFYNKENTIPNGCCNVKECSINELYDIISDQLLLLV